MRLLRTPVLAAAAALTVVAAAAGCSDGSAPPHGSSATYRLSEDTPAARGPLASATWSLYAEPQSLDYLHAFDYLPNTVLANVCDQLLRVTPDLKVVPGLAVSFANPDPLTWVYKLREGVRFHSGGTMTAQDVVASLKRHLDPALGSAWRSAFRDVAAITATGPLEVTIRLTKPNVLLNQQLAASPGTVESAAFLARAGSGYGTPQGGVDCTGPYAVERWTPGTSIVLRKNAEYWDTSLVPRTERLEFVVMPDPAARMNALMLGEVDGAYMLPTASYAKLSDTGAGELYFGVNTGAYLAAVTNLDGTLGDVRVRRALSLAIDREAIVADALGGYGKPAKSALPSAGWGTVPPARAQEIQDALPPLARDLGAAKKLVAEAGAQGRKVVVATSDIGAEISVTAQAIRSAGREIGLDVELRTVSPEAYSALFTDQAARAGIDLLITSGYDSTPDPLEFYQSLRTGEGANYGGYTNPEYDAIAQQAMGTADPAARAELTVRLQEIVLRDLPDIPLFETPHSMFMNNRATGATANITQLYWPWAATLGAAG
ncbi:ABC transporter substrate-binding protein [Yinghuangia soli]|uniref:ABC transporter substrate-binding protein n=1 Tax=Yinghuangia soli TaxID=2908204 RepID=A0AA41PY84_9ACTN|nr:ABC transporter substrate-binding protein [Yinghuangia soli]MCF2527585.1 ABC transporter substrate-binding protein [Yinghuangia soli]